MTLKWVEVEGSKHGFRLASATLSSDITITLAFSPYSGMWRLWCAPFYPDEPLRTTDLDEAKRRAISWVRMRIRKNVRELEALDEEA